LCCSTLDAPASQAGNSTVAQRASILRKDQQQDQVPSETSDRRKARILRGFHEKSVATYLHPNAILHEVQQLYSVSDRLDSLAEQHPSVSEALLEVLVATKIAPLSGLDPASA
jgi:hypothetical protein